MDYTEDIKNAVAEAMANSEALQDLQRQVREYTDPQPKTQPFSDDEARVAAEAIAAHRASQKLAAARAAEEAQMAAMVKEWRSSFITTGRIAPETAEEKRLWREAHGTPYDGNLLTR